MKIISPLAIALLSLLASCGTKAPETTTQDHGQTMDERKAGLDDATAKAAKMREEAARLRMSGSPEDDAKAGELERKAARLESDALNNLNPGFNLQ